MVEILELIPTKINILGVEIVLFQLVIAVIIVVVGVFVAKTITLVIDRVLRRYIPDTVEIVIRRVVYWGIILASLLSAAGTIGIDFTGILLAGGIAGIIIGFATQSIVANLISGIFLHLDRPVKIGDPVEVVEMDVSGIIIDITPFSTRLRRFDGVFVRIPNEKIFTSQLRNFTALAARRIEVTVGIAYKEEASKAIDIFNKMLEKHPKILAEPAPNISVWELADSSVNINVWCWVPVQEWFSVRSEIMKLVKEELDKANIEIPFPQRVIWFAQNDKIDTLRSNSS